MKDLRRLLREAWLQYGMELRYGIRDPHILGYAVLMPLFLYPALIFATFQVLAVREARQANLRYRIGAPAERDLASMPDGAPQPRDLLQRLRTTRRFEVTTVAGGVPGSAADREKRLRATGLDALVAFDADREGKLTVTLCYRGVDGSEGLVRRFDAALEKYRTWYGRRTLRLAGGTYAPVDVSYRNAATAADMGGFILARLLPVTLVIFLGTGAFYTAIDVTAGERERGTFETTLLLPSSRLAIVLGKYLYVLTMAMASALVNFASLALTLRHALALLGEGLHIQIAVPAFTLVMILLSLLALGLAVSPLMMGLAFLTRSFREGQGLVGPVYALLIAPIALASLPGMTLTGGLALVPMVNITLGLREVIEKGIAGFPFLIAILETLSLAGLFVLIAARLLQREEAVMGSEREGSVMAAAFRLLRKPALP